MDHEDALQSPGTGPARWQRNFVSRDTKAVVEGCANPVQGAGGLGGLTTLMTMHTNCLQVMEKPSVARD